MLYLRLFFEFLKIGLFAVGGGMATVPFLTDLSDRSDWFTHTQLADMVAVAESTPGAIGVNTATYVGYTVGGIPGGIIATLGLITPSIIIVLLVAAIMAVFRENRFVVTIFKYLRPASLGLVLSAGISVSLIALFYHGQFAFSDLNLRAVCFAVVLFCLMQIIPQTKRVHPALWIVFSAGVGIVLL